MKKNHPNTKNVIDRFKRFLLEHGMADLYRKTLKERGLKERPGDPTAFIWNAFSWCPPERYAGSTAEYTMWQDLHLEWMRVCRAEGWTNFPYDWH